MLRRVIADRTTIVVTHDPLDAYLLSDRVVVVGRGHIVEQGPTRDVLERPRAEFTAQLAGVSLLTGRRTPSGLLTEDGITIAAVESHRVPAASAAGRSDAPIGSVRERDPADTRGATRTGGGTRVTAALRPSAVHVDTRSAGWSPPVSEGMNIVAATVRDLEPHGDLVRVRTEWLAADVTPGRVADLDLAPGTPVVLSFAATDVDLYPA